jgi:hypothetical protein
MSYIAYLTQFTSKNLGKSQNPAISKGKPLYLGGVYNQSCSFLRGSKEKTGVLRRGVLRQRLVLYANLCGMAHKGHDYATTRRPDPKQKLEGALCG